MLFDLFFNYGISILFIALIVYSVIKLGKNIIMMPVYIILLLIAIGVFSSASKEIVPLCRSRV